MHGESAAASIHGDAHGLQLDVTDQASIDAAVARVRREFGRLDVLVDNAAHHKRRGGPVRALEQRFQAGRLGNVSLDEVRRVFEPNVFAVIAITQAALPLLREGR